MFDPSMPPLIQETLLKKRRSLEELAVVRAETVGQQKTRKRVIRGEDIKLKRPEQFLMEFRIRQGSLNKMNRRKSQVDKKTKSDLVPKLSLKNTVGVAVRIHGGRHSSKVIKADLEKLGLKNKYDAIFFKLDREGIARLKALDSYIAYGFISNKAVTELLQRRAYTLVEGEKKPLSDNVTIENVLGDKNILCLSDLSHEIFNIGPNFDSALQILCPFNLSAPVGNFEKTILQAHDKVETKGGFLVDGIDTFLQKIL